MLLILLAQSCDVLDVFRVLMYHQCMSGQPLLGPPSQSREVRLGPHEAPVGVGHLHRLWAVCLIRLLMRSRRLLHFNDIVLNHMRCRALMHYSQLRIDIAGRKEEQAK